MNQHSRVIINQSDLDKLEECRCALFDFLEEKGLTEDIMDLVKITSITQHMWNLANKKHPVYVPVKDLVVDFQISQGLDKTKLNQSTTITKGRN